LPNALSKVEQLRGVSYDLKDSGKHEIGVIAEEVGAVVPEVVTYEDNGKDARGVDYSRLTALLIEATKEQQALIHKQQQQISAQQAKMKAEETRIDEQQAQIRSSVKLAQTQQAQIASQAAQIEAQQAGIAELMSQVKAIQTSLKTSGRTGAEVRTVKARVPTVQQ
jgi:chromosome segregation ATPase